MSLAIGLLMLLTGLAAIMAFGLFMFYAWLPLLYALVGFDVGLLLGRAFTGDVGTTAVVLGLASAFILGAASCRGGQTANPRSRCRRRDRARKMTRALARGSARTPGRPGANGQVRR